MILLVLAGIAMLAYAGTSIVVPMVMFGDEPERTKSTRQEQTAIICDATPALNYWLYYGCLASHAESERFSLGLRYERISNVKYTSRGYNSFFVTPTLNAHASSFYFEPSFGVSLADGLPLAQGGFGFALDYRMGNRWKLGSGLALGINYLGYTLSFPNGPVDAKLVGVELGYFF